MEPIQLAIAELQAEVRRQRDEIHFLRNQPPNQPAKNHRPKPVLPDPEKFSGQSHKFDTWLPSIKAKLRVDGEAIGDAVSQFYYVYLNLDSHVQAMVLPQLNRAEELKIWNYTTILDQLSRVYDNPNKVQEAEDKLLSLKQGNDSLSTYMAKFERILYEARGEEWPDVTKISTFRIGLNQTIRGRLAQQLNLPRTYPEFIRVVQQLASRSSMPLSHPNGGSQPNRGEPMDIGSVDIATIDVQPSQTTITAQLAELRKLERYCVRCRSHGHDVKDCPEQPHISNRLVVANLSDDEDSDSYSDLDDNYPEDLDWKKRIGRS